MVAVGSFFVVITAAFGVPWLLGHHWLWDHARLVGPVLGGAYFYGTRRWWFRHAGMATGGSVSARPGCTEHAERGRSLPVLLSLPEDSAEALHRLHRRARWAIARWWGTWVALALGLLAVVVGNMTTVDVNQLIDSQPHQKVQVLSVHRHALDNTGPDITVSIPGDGAEDLEYGDYVEPVPRVGDHVDVVVNPDDPTAVIPVAYRHSSDNSRWIGLLIFLGLSGMTAYLGWFNGATKRAAARSVRRATEVHRLTVQSVDDERLTLAAEDGTLLSWNHGGERELRLPGPGTYVIAAGHLRPGGWAAMQHRHWVLWTVTPLAASRH